MKKVQKAIRFNPNVTPFFDSKALRSIQTIRAVDREKLRCLGKCDEHFMLLTKQGNKNEKIE